MKAIYFSHFLPIFLLNSFIISAQCDCPGDDEAPLMTIFSGEHTVNCDVDFYDYIPTFTDNCDSDLQIDLTVDTAFIDSKRWLRNSEFVMDPNFHSIMSLFLSNGFGDFRQYELDYGGIEYQEDEGTASLDGHMKAINITDAGFNFHLELINRNSFAEWINHPFPTNYRDDFDLTTDEYLYWDYYLLSPNSFMTGTGRFEGSSISIYHAPGNNYYAWQEGIAANGRSSNNGAGGWASCYGSFMFDSEPLSFAPAGFSASLFFDFEDCLIPQYTLTWTGTDDCGNSTSHSHVLTTSVNSPTAGNCPCGVFGCINEDAVNYDPYATLSIGQCYGCSGDFNGDGAINSGDLVAFLADFGCMSDCLYDINGDGTTNTGDLTILLSTVGQDCE